MADRYIGVTGFTTIEDVDIMNKSLGSSLGMYGILMSHSTLKGKPIRGRYAALCDVKELMHNMPDKSLRTIHWCDGGWRNRENAWKGIEEAINSAGGECNAIQLNMAYPLVDFFKTLKEKYNFKTIFQIEAQMFEDPKEMAKKMQPYKNFVDYVIIDQSMGAGIPIDPAVSKAVAKEMQGLGLGVVFAGGLCKDNVVEIADMIKEFEASVDEEGRLMNPAGSLDHGKVKDYVREARKIIK